MPYKSHVIGILELRSSYIFPASQSWHWGAYFLSIHFFYILAKTLDFLNWVGIYSYQYDNIVFFTF